MVDEWGKNKRNWFRQWTEMAKRHKKKNVERRWPKVMGGWLEKIKIEKERSGQYVHTSQPITFCALF